MRIEGPSGWRIVVSFLPRGCRGFRALADPNTITVAHRCIPIWPAESSEKIPDASKRRKAEAFQSFAPKMAGINQRLEEACERPLQIAEFLGGRLYTGPMFVKYNSVLRRHTKVPFMEKAFWTLCDGNAYVTTLHAINSVLVNWQPARKPFRQLE